MCNYIAKYSSFKANIVYIYFTKWWFIVKQIISKNLIKI